MIFFVTVKHFKRQVTNDFFIYINKEEKIGFRGATNSNRPLKGLNKS